MVDATRREVPLYERSIAFQLLHAEHDEIDRLLGELVAGAGDRDQVRRMLGQALDRHMAVEEAVFYPALARLEMLGSFVQRMRQQHGLIREAMDTVSRMEFGEEEFAFAAQRLDELVDSHVEEEESRAFGYAAEHLAGELEALAVEMEHQRECERGAYGVG